VAARTKARKRAFQILFEADQRGVDVQSVLADWMRHARTDPRQPPVNGSGRDLRLILRGDTTDFVKSRVDKPPAKRRLAAGPEICDAT